jgi:DNA (cytosine-5)-methyltransferase 1
MNQKNRTALSLFSGAGGFDLGIEQAGFDVLGCVEIDQHCCNTLALNANASGHDDRKIYNCDIRSLEAATLRREIGIKKGSLDLLFGGPPCQSFSLIGKQSGLDDHRGMLIFEFPRFAREFRPKVIVMEQVKGFLSANGRDGVRGGAKNELIEELEELGYSCQVQVLNSRDYGVAQSRERVFLVAARTPTRFQYPEPTHGPADEIFGLLPFVTVSEALSGLKGPKRHVSSQETLDSHVDVTPDRDRERISYVSSGSCLAKSDAPPSIKGRLTLKDTTKFLRLDPCRQSNTLRCGEIFYHPTEDRYLTPREYMRIHSYPDSYRLTGPIRSRTGQVKNLDQHRQVANSVPPLLAKALGLAVLHLFESGTTKKQK